MTKRELLLTVKDNRGTCHEREGSPLRQLHRRTDTEVLESMGVVLCRKGSFGVLEETTLSCVKGFSNVLFVLVEGLPHSSAVTRSVLRTLDSSVERTFLDTPVSEVGVRGE